MPPKAIPLNTIGLRPGDVAVTTGPAAQDMLGWLPVRAPVTIADQLKHAIERGLLSSHGPPNNRSYYDEADGKQYIYWKWGTFSTWSPTTDINVLFVRYCMLCMNGDMELAMPITLMNM
eukprot:4454841-Heterocapsa_arctica.AAC.1